MQMGNVLRQEVLADLGDSNLKRLCLDFISKLRLDSNNSAILNGAKDGPSAFHVAEQTRLNYEAKMRTNNPPNYDEESAATDDEYEKMKANVEANAGKKRKGGASSRTDGASSLKCNSVA